MSSDGRTVKHEPRGTPIGLRSMSVKELDPASVASVPVMSDAEAIMLLTSMSGSSATVNYSLPKLFAPTASARTAQSPKSNTLPPKDTTLTIRSPAYFCRSNVLLSFS